MLAWSIPARLLTPLSLGAAGLAAGSLAAGILITERALHIRSARRFPPDPAQADAVVGGAGGGSWEAVEIESTDGVPLRAWLFSPPRPATEAVLIQHGIASTRHSVLVQAEMMLRRGYLVLTPDSRGHGASGDALVTYGIHEAGDLGLWCRLLRERHRAQAVFGLGESMGAAILLQSVVEDSPFEAVAAECSFSDFHRIAYERLARRLGIGMPWAAPLLFPVVEVGFAYALLRHGVDLYRASPIDSLRRARIPVLLIHGLADPSIPPEHSRRLYAANPAICELWEVPGAGHTEASTTAPEEFDRRVGGFLARVLDQRNSK